MPRWTVQKTGWSHADMVWSCFVAKKVFLCHAEVLRVFRHAKGLAIGFGDELMLCASTCHSRKMGEFGAPSLAESSRSVRAEVHLARGWCVAAGMKVSTGSGSSDHIHPITLRFLLMWSFGMCASQRSKTPKEILRIWKIECPGNDMFAPCVRHSSRRSDTAQRSKRRRGWRDPLQSEWLGYDAHYGFASFLIKWRISAGMPPKIW